MINVFQPSLGAEELAAVEAVFKSNWIGKGSKTAEFEKAFAAHIGVDPNNVRSISCCTEGLFQSMSLLGLHRGAEVILPTVSFVGAANAILDYVCKPVFCDVDPRTLNATVETIERCITKSTRAVMVLHYGGVPCDIEDILRLCNKNNLYLIEDSACSVASTYNGKACGTFGDIGVWSFDSMKILCSGGDGGMIYCKNPEIAQLAQEQTYLGQTSQSGFTSSAKERWWEFSVSCYGRRAIMNDAQSAVGLVQLKRLPEFIRRRRDIHAMYDMALERTKSNGAPWLWVPPDDDHYKDTAPSYYLYWVQVDPKHRDALATYLKSKDIYTTFRYYPLHLVYGHPDSLPNAEYAALSTLCLPIHQGMSGRDVLTVAEAVNDFGRAI